MNEIQGSRWRPAGWTMEEARGLAVQHVAMAKLTASKMYSVL